MAQAIGFTSAVKRKRWFCSCAVVIKVHNVKISNRPNGFGTNTRVETMAKSRAYDETLKQTLTDPEEAAEYLNAALEEGDPAALLLALKDVTNVHGGMAKVAEAANLNRESMYRMLSENGNPRISSLDALLHALGLRLAIAPDKSRPTSVA